MSKISTNSLSYPPPLSSLLYILFIFNPSQPLNFHHHIYQYLNIPHNHTPIVHSKYFHSTTHLSKTITYQPHTQVISPPFQSPPPPIMSSLFTSDEPSGGKVPLLESTNYYSTVGASTTTPSKSTKIKPTCLSTQTPPSASTIGTSSIKKLNQGPFNTFGFNTPLRTTHLDPT